GRRFSEDSRTDLADDRKKSPPSCCDLISRSREPRYASQRPWPAPSTDLTAPIFAFSLSRFVFRLTGSFSNLPILFGHNHLESGHSGCLKFPRYFIFRQNRSQLPSHHFRRCSLSRFN